MLSDQKIFHKIKGRISRKKGKRYEKQSVDYIMKHSEKYGITERYRIFCVPNIPLRFMEDLFPKVYKTVREKVIVKQKDREPYETYRPKDLKAGWDIMTMPEELNEAKEGSAGLMDRATHYLYLVQVKSTKPDDEYLEALLNFKVPWFVKKELHIWKGDELKIMPLI